jgi:hypothetical protein
MDVELGVDHAHVAGPVGSSTAEGHALYRRDDRVMTYGPD